MILYGIYTLMTVAEIIILIVCGMPVFDSFCISFGAAGTGGFGIRNDSLASYAPHLQVLVTLFMIAFGVNFNIYYLILCKKFRQAFRSEELRGVPGRDPCNHIDHHLEYPHTLRKYLGGPAPFRIPGWIHYHDDRILD